MTTISKLRRVLLPLDGTPVAEVTPGVVAPLLREAEVIDLLRVLPPGTGEQPLEERKAEASRYLQRVADLIVAGGARGRIDPQVRCGEPVLEILEAAAASGPDLVAMATHGQASSSSGRAYGSVAAQVVRRSRFPVLVLDPLRRRQADGGVRRIALPFDGSRVAVACLPYAAAVARAFGAEVDLIFVHTSDQDSRRDVTAMLDPHRHTLERAGVRNRTLLVATTGAQTVAARLAQAIESDGADLVIVPTGGREGVVHWTLGPVGEGILRACHRPVLIRPVP